MRFQRFLPPLITVLFTLLCCAGEAQTVSKTPLIGFEERFEGERPSWRLLHTENRAGTRQAVREEKERHSGSRSERWELQLTRESNVILGHSLGFPCVIDDLDPMVWIKSPQLGITVGAQIVLPNSLDPQTGRPITFLVAGSKYSEAGQWQQLGFRDKSGRPDLKRQAEQTVKMLRAERGINFDFEGFYVRQLLLYIEGNDRVATVWIDDLEIAGHVPYWNAELLDRFEYEANVPRQTYGNAASTPVAISGKQLAFRFDPINFIEFKLKAGSGYAYLTSAIVETPLSVTEWAPSTIQYAESGYQRLPTADPFTERRTFDRTVGRFDQHESPSTIRLAAIDPLSEAPVSEVEELSIQMSGQAIRVNNREIAVRAIRYRGEPLQELWKLGFNAVWLSGKPTLELLMEARSVGIFLICSPPSQSELAEMRRGTTAGGAKTVPLTDKLYDSVLVWNMGDQCVSDERVLNSYFQWSKELRSADRRRSRPLICTAASGMKDYSRFIDIQLMERSPFFTSFELRDYFEWQTQLLEHLAVPATPAWSTIQTQPDQRTVMQWQLFSGGGQAMPVVTYEQIKMLVHMAVAAGSHGLLFESETPLTANDPETAYRRKALELINRELDLIEEWFSKGKTVTILKSNRPNVMTAVLETNRSRLLLPLWGEAKLQNAIGAASAGNIRYVVPGVPDDYDAYHLIPGGIRPLDPERVAGGMRLMLDEANLNSVIFFTSNPEIRSAVELRSRKLGSHMASLAIELARLQRASFEATFGELRRAQQAGAIPERDKVPLIGMEEQESLLRLTQTDIDQSAWFFERGDFASAFLQAEKATRGVRVAAKDLWSHAIRFDLQPMMTPVSLSYHNLPAFIETYNRAPGAVREQNRLASGTAEDLTLWDNEWLTSTHRVDGVVAEANLASEAARSQLNGICIEVRPEDPARPVGYVETAPIWMTLRQGVPVRAGEMICVTGWINIKEPITGSHDGVMIYDNLGGPALALRFHKTPGWRNFAFYRVAPGDGRMELTLSVCGFGKVYFDDIEITSVHFPTVPLTPPPAETPTNTPYWQRLNPFQLIPQNWGRNTPNPN